MKIGEKLLAFRARHNLTQMQLADLFGVSYQTIWRTENNISIPTAMHKIKFENKMKEWEEKQNVVQM